MTDSDGQSDKNGVMDRLMELIREMPDVQRTYLLDQLEDKPRKREFIRKECLITAHYAVQDKIYKGCIHDISRSGVFIESRETFFVGQKVVMTFSFNTNKISFMLAGKIVRCTPDGIGVLFNPLTIDQEDELRKMVESMGDIWEM